MKAMRQDLLPNFHSPEHGHTRRPHWLFLTAAYTILPFIRGPQLGYDIVKPNFTIIPVLALIFFSFVLTLYPPAGPGFLWLPGFAVASFMLSTAIFMKRLQEVHGPSPYHAADGGYSFLTRRTHLPVWLAEIILVPSGLAILGYGIAHTFSFLLGYYLIICAGSYAIMARYENSNHRRAAIDLANLRTQATVFNQRSNNPTGRPQAGYGNADEAEEAGLGHHAAATGDQGAAPDVTVWRKGGDDFTPEFQAWFGKGSRKGPPAR